ncbi:hypothetical protein ACHQM5_024131 [Ranunculus cassubicifolius]
MAVQMTLNLSCFLLASMVITAPFAEGKINCSDVKRGVNSCRFFVRGQGNVPPTCCNGLRQLQRNARTTPDRQATCACLKQASINLGGVIWSKAESLPGICRLYVPYKISREIDCSRYSLPFLFLCMQYERLNAFVVS